MNRGHLLLLALPLAAILLLGLDLITDRVPLGHDEAVYSLKAKTLVEDTSSDYFWSAYRAPGLPAALVAVFPVGSSASYLRLVVLGFGLAVVGLTYLIGRELFGTRAGLIAAGGVAVTPLILASSTQVWPDVPGAALSLLVIWLVLVASRGERFSWWVVATAPLVWLATYVRFGAPIPLALGVVVVVACRWRTGLRSIPQLAAFALISGAGIWAILFAPAVTGADRAPYGAIRELQERNAFPFHQGIRDYFRQLGFLFGGPAGFVVVTGVVASIVLAARRSLDRWVVAVPLGIAVLTGIVIAVRLHGEYRYLSPVFPFLWIAAGAGIAALTRSWDRQVLVAAGMAALLLAGLSARSDASIQNEFNRTFEVIQQASQDLDDQVDGPCGAITSYVPQVGWYSDCITENWDLDEVSLNPSGFPEDAPTFLFWVERGKRQPDAALTDEYRAATEGLILEEGKAGDGKAQYVQVWRITTR